MSWKYVLNEVLDLSKVVLWVSVDQTAAKLQSVKIGGLEEILPLDHSRTTRLQPRSESWTIKEGLAPAPWLRMRGYYELVY